MTGASNTLRLKIKYGPLDAEPGRDSEELSFEPEVGVITLGRPVTEAPPPMIRMRSNVVSRAHAAITFNDDGWYLHDEGSRHGTRLNNLNLVAKQDSIQLQNGDRIQIGRTVIQVRLPAADPDNQSAADDLSSIMASDLLGDISVVSEYQLQGLAQRRLDVLLQAAARLSNVSDLSTLSQAIAEIAADGTSSPRALVLGRSARSAEWDVLGRYETGGMKNADLEISRSLVAVARQGMIAQLLAHQQAEDPDHSIDRLNIQTAICAPLNVDQKVDAVLYLDTRGNERPIAKDAVEYCKALAKLGALALANLQRRHLEYENAQKLKELNDLRRAQELIMPPASGEVGPLRYVFHSEPGTIVAGDLFDIVKIDSLRTLALLGDVMGKGAAAGLMMASVQAFVRARLHADKPLSELADEINTYFIDRFQGEGFVTLWLGLFDAQTQQLTCVDAGHGHWCVIRPDVAAEAGVSQGGPPIGAVDAVSYQQSQLPWNAGDRLVLFTDGLVEQANEQGEMFGEPQVLQRLTGNCGVAEDVASLSAAWHAFRGDQPTFDDLTIASIEPRHLS